jgi:hypothetical protein
MSMTTAQFERLMRERNRREAKAAVADLPARPKKLPRPRAAVRTTFDAAPAAMSFWVPARTVSEQNARDHRFAVTDRKHAHRAAVQAVMGRTGVRALLAEMGPPYVVTLCRVGRRRLDGHDNLRSAMKWLVDSIAELLGVDDGDEAAVRWAYEQDPGLYAAMGDCVRVKVERGETGKAVTA